MVGMKSFGHKVDRKEYLDFAEKIIQDEINSGLAGMPDSVEVEREYITNHSYRHLKTIELIPPRDKLRILNIGTGHGVLEYFIKSKFGYDVETIDIEEEVEGYYGKRMKRLGISQEACDLNREKLPYDANSFDVVIFSEVLEHLLVSPLKPLLEIHRILKKDGNLILVTPNVASFSHILFLICGRHFMPEYPMEMLTTMPDLKHTREYTTKEMKALLAQAEFNIDTLYMSRYQDRFWIDKKYDMTKNPGMVILRNIFRILISTITFLFPRFRSTIIIRAKK